MISGTMSGSGKTTVTLGLISALVKRGVAVQPFKTGPDFIDPGHHTSISGKISRNLDGWMLSETYNRNCFYKYAEGADVALVEGVMGLYDGYDGKSDKGSSAETAKILKLPVVLIVNAKSMARSAAALVKGFELFDPALSFAGVIFNNIGSERHLQYLKDGMIGNSNIPVLGGIPRTKDIAVPERHLGLYTSEDHPVAGRVSETMGILIEEYIDLDTLLERLPDIDIPDAAFLKDMGNVPVPDKQRKSRVRIGVAKDNAFCFYYQDNLDILEENGAEIVYFSPINDKHLPKNLSGLYFGGGYPELYAEKLSSNEDMRRQILDNSKKGMPVYAECGGFMYLTKGIKTLEEDMYEMVGVFDVKAEMMPRFKSLGYREITLISDGLLGEKGAVFRGHEFHYSKLSNWNHPPETVYKMTRRAHVEEEAAGFLIDNTLGSYVHLHFGSNGKAGESFVNNCRRYNKESS